MTDRDRLLELGSAALARGAWFEAHECWERAWHLSVVPDRPAVQALAQLAAALVHLSNGRRRGATNLPRTPFPLDLVARLYRFRWQVDIFRSARLAQG